MVKDHHIYEHRTISIFVHKAINKLKGKLDFFKAFVFDKYTTEMSIGQ